LLENAFKLLPAKVVGEHGVAAQSLRLGAIRKQVQGRDHGHREDEERD
jgi:hypothetical protein